MNRGMNRNYSHIYWLKKTLAVFALLLGTACSALNLAPAPTALPETSTPTPQMIITATLPVIETERPTMTPVPVETLAVPAILLDGQTTSQLNVRQAPSADSPQMGTIEIFADVQVVGKDSTEKWWQIVFPVESPGRGWVLAEFVKGVNAAGVPLVDASAPVVDSAPVTEAIPTGEAVAVLIPSVVPTPVPGAAPLDGDSAASPAVNATLSEASIPFFSHASDVSFPNGDAEDWLQFSLQGNTGQQKIVAVVIDCFGSASINLELYQSGVLLQNWDSVTCGQRHQLQLYLFVGAPYSLRLFPAQGNASLGYLSYITTVSLSK